MSGAAIRRVRDYPARSWTLLARNVLCCSCKYVENEMKTEADDEDGGHID